MSHPITQRTQAMAQAMSPFINFLGSDAMRRAVEPGVSNFAIGNPNEMALAGFVDALQKWSVPKSEEWFGYSHDITSAKETVAAYLTGRVGMSFEAADVSMTNGAFAGITALLNMLVEPEAGDEIIFISPPWFFYEAMIANAGGKPVRVRIDPVSYDLDLNAIEAAITPKTRAVIVNSPNNPTGKIYQPDTLTNLGKLLTDASDRIGRTIYLISDEAYNRIIYDGRAYYSATAYYPNSFLVYTYGKTLLAPGQRIGYIALPPTMPDRESMRDTLFLNQIVTGFLFPNGLLQHGLADLDKLSIDIEYLQYKRDWMVNGLREVGYDVHSPEGTFYLLPRSPIPDDVAFVNLLAEKNIVCLPGQVVEMPGYFRISLTANDQMIERALPGFKTAFEQARR